MLGSAATLQASVKSASAFAKAPELAIIDTHQHLWDLSKQTLPWLEAGSKLNHNALPTDYRKATEGLNVTRAIYMEVDVTPAQQVEEAESVLELIRSRKTPTVAAVISGRPSSEAFSKYLAGFKDAPAIKGVRQVLHSPKTPSGYCLDPAFIRGIQALGKAGLMFDLCMRATELRDGAKLIDACPDTVFILDHCGNADVRSKDLSAWRREIAEVAKRRRVVCKVSGIVASTQGMPWTADDLAPIVNHVLDTFGPDRVMFGGDWPVCTLGATYRQWVEALKTIVRDRPEKDQRKLFHENAERVYRLGPEK